jgi:hypothetical protein
MRGASASEHVRVRAAENEPVHATHFVVQLEHDCGLFLTTRNRPGIKKAIAALIEGKPIGLVHAHGNLVRQRAGVDRPIF